MTAPGTPPPVWLRPAVALAYWTQSARAADAVTSRQLARLRTHARWLVDHSQPSSAAHGLGVVVVGDVPPVPSSSEIERWARDAWDRAIAAGTATERALATHARRMLSAAEAALQRVSRALANERDATVRATLEAVEAGLTAILRPLARGIATATGPIAAPALLIGLGLVLVMLGSRRR